MKTLTLSLLAMVFALMFLYIWNDHQAEQIETLEARVDSLETIVAINCNDGNCPFKNWTWKIPEPVQMDYNPRLAIKDSNDLP